MGRKADRLAALERRSGDDRHAMEAAVEWISAEMPEAARRLLEERLGDDPRPLSAEGSLHWLHIRDGDRLVWRLVSELIDLHDAEARRLGRPEWRRGPTQWMEAETPDAPEEEPGPEDSEPWESLRRLIGEHGLDAVEHAIDGIAVADDLDRRPAP